MTSAHPHTDIRIFLKECTSLAKKGYDTNLIAPNAPSTKINQVTIHGVNNRSKSRFTRMTKTVWSVYKKALEVNAEVYHFHDPELLFVGFLLKVKGKAVIYDVHEDVPRQIITKSWIKPYFRKIIANTFEFLENKLAKRFDAIITATPTINERFQKIGCYAINVNNFPLLSEFDFIKNDWSKKERAVCYIGGINEIRGIYQMVDALGEGDVKLFLAGNFQKNEVREKTSKIQGWNMVEELGIINRKEVTEVLSKSVGGLVLFHPAPNHINAQPNKMFEYMASGIPVISSFFPLWKEIIEEHECGICVDPLKVEEIAKSINWLVNNPDKALKMGENGRKAVKEKYNWENEEEKLFTLYENIR